MVAFSFIPAFITGQIFSELTGNISDVSKSAGIYSADLAGSALGFIAVSALLIPLIGIEMTIYALAIFILIGLVTGIQTGRK